MCNFQPGQASNPSEQLHLGVSQTTRAGKRKKNYNTKHLSRSPPSKLLSACKLSLAPRSNNVPPHTLQVHFSDYLDEFLCSSGCCPGNTALDVQRCEIIDTRRLICLCLLCNHRGMFQLEDQVHNILPRIPVPLQEAAVRLLSKDTRQRPTAQLLSLIKYFR